MNTESFANSKYGNDEISSKHISYVPVSPRDWSSTDSEIPDYLRFVKAKTALVPLAEFVWGNPNEELPVELRSNLKSVHVPSIIWNDKISEAPESLRLIKAKYAKVQLPAKNWEDTDISAEEISLLQ